MNKLFKKIAATAMAFTVLGAGSVVTKTITPQFDNSITASAASYNYDPCYWNYPTPSFSSSVPYFAIGSKGNQVKWVQASINWLFGAKLDVDGKYGNLTYQAVTEFQQWYNDAFGWYYGNIGVDGYFGPESLDAMQFVQWYFSY